MRKPLKLAVTAPKNLNRPTLALMSIPAPGANCCSHCRLSTGSYDFPKTRLTKGNTGPNFNGASLPPRHKIIVRLIDGESADEKLRERAFALKTQDPVDADEVSIAPHRHAGEGSSD